MYKCKFAFIIFFLSCSVYPQATMDDEQTKKIEVKGTVLDSLNVPVYAAAVFKNLKTNEEYGTTTGLKTGYFELSLPAGTYDLSISALGYWNYNFESVFVKDTLLDDVVLKEKKQLLDEVVIKASVSKKIRHNATGMQIDIKRDSVLKTLSLAETLGFLPFVKVEDGGSILMQGEPAEIMIDGRFQNVSKASLFVLLNGLQGKDIDNMELISSPSAKYGNDKRKIININILKEKKDGFSGSISNRISNADFFITPNLHLKYKTGKLVFRVLSTPFSYSERSSKSISNRVNLNSGIGFDEITKRNNSNRYSNINLNLDYTIDPKHSLYVNYETSGGMTDGKHLYNSEQYNTTSLESFFTTEKRLETESTTFSANFGYRYDINEKGLRLDFAGSYSNKINDERSAIYDEMYDVEDDESINSSSKKNLESNSEAISTRLDFEVPLSSKHREFETGIKYDKLSMANRNLFSTFEEEVGDYVINESLSNAFDYEESLFSVYVSFKDNMDRFKYALGVRFESINTHSLSLSDGSSKRNAYDNFLPVVSLKYMINKVKTSHMGLSYRKGYMLPPYLYLNPFEIYFNGTTIEKGNPNLTQSIYHNLSLDYNIKNKYLFSFSYYTYKDYFASTQVLQNEKTIISYDNIGKKQTYRFFFNTNFDLYTWWRTYIDASFDYNFISGEAVETDVGSFFLSLNNTFNLPEDFLFTLTTSFNNGKSAGFETPNRFLRFFSSASITKRLFDNKLSLNFRAIDIFGVNTKNKAIYQIDNTHYSNREIFQTPKLFFNLTYRFESGKKINEKSKKSSSIDESRF